MKEDTGERFIFNLERKNFLLVNCRYDKKDIRYKIQEQNKNKGKKLYVYVMFLHFFLKNVNENR